MQVLLAVIDDLTQFALSKLFGVFRISTPTITHLLPNMSTYEVATVPTSVEQTELSNSKSLQKKSRTISSFIEGESYFVGDKEVSVYIDPVIAFDTCITSLHYGDAVSVLKFGGRWAHVKTRDDEGWIFKDSLREQASDVFPEIVTDVLFTAENNETQKLRWCIKDMFGGDTANVELSDAEYVAYKLKRKDVHIVWPTERPRIAGTWQKILRGASGVHLGISPKTDSVMEYIVDDIGHLCFVEAVFPDDSIKISGISLEDDGQFSEKMMMKEEWRELRPIFIEVL